MDAELQGALGAIPNWEHVYVVLFFQKCSVTVFCCSQPSKPSLSCCLSSQFHFLNLLFIDRFVADSLAMGEAAVEMAKDWRTDRYLRKLEAMMAVVDKDVSLILTGTGDVLEPTDGLIAIGSGGNYALAAAKALMDQDLDAEEIGKRALGIAADICVYTNNNLTVETLDI